LDDRPSRDEEAAGSLVTKIRESFFGRMRTSEPETLPHSHKQGIALQFLIAILFGPQGERQSGDFIDHRDSTPIIG
jgi:hypothetical protein